MRLRERSFHSVRTPNASRATDAPATVDAWLDVFDRLLRLPGAQKDAIREELRSHLTDRVRDLMLAGADRDEAMRQAVSELGDTAELAEQFRHANRYPRRRLIMNGALIGFGAAAVITAATIVTTTGQQPTTQPTVFNSTELRADEIDTLESVKIDVATDMTPRQIVARIADTEQIGVSVNWGNLEEIGVSPDDPLGLSGENISAHTVLTELAHRYNDGWDGIDWRLEGRRLTIDRRMLFDLRERVLASYDVDAIHDVMMRRYDLPYAEANEQIAGLIHELVEPEQWEANGGVVGQLSIVSGRMFVHAPNRMQEKVSWILNELAKTGAVDGGAQAAADARSLPSASEQGGQRGKNELAMWRMREIHKAWQLWAWAHDGRDLETLHELVSAGKLSATDLRSPYGPSSDGVDYWFDYDSLEPGPNIDRSRRIIGLDRAMYESANNVATLFADGHIELLSLKDLTTLLAMPGNAEAQPDLPERRAAADENRALQRYALAHTDAQEVAALLSAAIEGGSEIVVDPRTNSLMVETAESRVEPWTALLERLDHAQPGE